VPTPEIAHAARVFAEGMQVSHGMPSVGLEAVAVWRAMFNDAALSPYTDFVDKSLNFLEALRVQGHLTAAQQIDALGGLLRQLGRHLTAYDLVTFHHRGANYPDALLLDAALKNYLSLIERQRDLLMGDSHAST